MSIGKKRVLLDFQRIHPTGVMTKRKLKSKIRNEQQVRQFSNEEKFRNKINIAHFYLMEYLMELTDVGWWENLEIRPTYGPLDLTFRFGN